MTDHLIDRTMPRTLTYVDILSLSRPDLIKVCRSFPHADRRLRRAQIRTACFRGFIQAAREASGIKHPWRCSTSGTVSDAITSFCNPGQNRTMSGTSLKEPAKSSLDNDIGEIKLLLEQLVNDREFPSAHQLSTYSRGRMPG
mmetsp:Transcript_44040/g.93735  ORF Transcript_44040/g.93735 Transcript_44040/m.93735 type:complete len:142 (+) Transcript_44040:2-427(+)